MNLVKWFRKNNTKVMAVVVIVIMFGFIGGGTLLQQLSKRSRVGALAGFGENNEITDNDLLVARRELEILKMLRADALLRSQDLHGVFLGELLFSDQRASLALINSLKQTIRQNQYGISEKQINDIYRRTVPPSIYWLLLQNEAEQAGIKVTNAQVGELLGRAIPQLFEGQTYSQLIGAIINRQRIPEEQVLATLGKLLAVLQYSSTVCSNESLTSRQIMQSASSEEERVNVAFVKFDTDVFDEKQDEPGAETIAEHFDKYSCRIDFSLNISLSNSTMLRQLSSGPPRTSLETITAEIKSSYTPLRFRRIRTIPTRRRLRKPRAMPRLPTVFHSSF